MKFIVDGKKGDLQSWENTGISSVLKINDGRKAGLKLLASHLGLSVSFFKRGLTLCFKSVRKTRNCQRAVDEMD